jgi:hypothetical protein
MAERILLFMANGLRGEAAAEVDRNPQSAHNKLTLANVLIEVDAKLHGFTFGKRDYTITDKTPVVQLPNPFPED